MQETWSRNQWQYIKWLASDKYVRTPPTETMLAAEIGVNPSTLWRWKQIPGLIEEVNETARSMLRENLAQIYAAIAREAIKGSYQHARLALELCGEVGSDGSTQAIQIIIQNTGIDTFPPHLSSITVDGSATTPAVQRLGLREEVGQNDHGNGFGG